MQLAELIADGITAGEISIRGVVQRTVCIDFHISVDCSCTSHTECISIHIDVVAQDIDIIDRHILFSGSGVCIGYRIVIDRGNRNGEGAGRHPIIIVGNLVSDCIRAIEISVWYVIQCIVAIDNDNAIGRTCAGNT